MKVACRKHDVIPVIVSDPRECEMPNVGLVRLRDEETGELVTIDTGRRKNRELFARLYRQQALQRDAIFRKLRLAPLHLETDRDIVEPLRKYFQQRESR